MRTTILAAALVAAVNIVQRPAPDPQPVALLSVSTEATTVGNWTEHTLLAPGGNVPLSDSFWESAAVPTWGASALLMEADAVGEADCRIGIRVGSAPFVDAVIGNSGQLVAFEGARIGTEARVRCRSNAPATLRSLYLLVKVAP